MSSSYLILTPPDFDTAGPDKIRFIRDGFSWLGLLFPVLWLLKHRMWLHALIAFGVNTGAAFMMDQPGFELAGLAVLVSLHLWVGLEGQNMHAHFLSKKNWSVVDLVTADDLDSAEDIYFSTAYPDHDMREEPRPHTPDQRFPSQTQASSTRTQESTSAKLMGFDEGP